MAIFTGIFVDEWGMFWGRDKDEGDNAYSNLAPCWTTVAPLNTDKFRQTFDIPHFCMCSDHNLNSCNVLHCHNVEHFEAFYTVLF
jgi:hypothetical protein